MRKEEEEEEEERFPWSIKRKSRKRKRLEMRFLLKQSSDRSSKEFRDPGAKLGGEVRDNLNQRELVWRLGC